MHREPWKGDQVQCLVIGGMLNAALRASIFLHFVVTLAENCF
jgi:hypothetical protein